MIFHGTNDLSEYLFADLFRERIESLALDVQTKVSHAVRANSLAKELQESFSSEPPNLYDPDDADPVQGRDPIA